MAEDVDSGEKTEEPSQYRLDEFRKRGEVAASKEVVNVIILFATALTLILSLAYIYEVLSEYITWLYNLDITLAFKENALKEIFKRTFFVCLKSTAPIFIVSMAIGVIVHVIQIGILFSPEVLNFNLGRINPLQGFKKIFSAKALVETVKGLLKFIIIFSISYIILKQDFYRYNGLLQVDMITGFTLGKTILVKLFFLILLGLGCMAVLDFAYEKFQYRKKLMQSKQEAKEEMKEREGNPEIRMRIKNIQRELAKKRMMAEVPKADVIVTNPTHYSVAIRYDGAEMVSPRVIAKGVDHMALQIRQIAKKHNVPIVENVPLARALYQNVKTGGSVPRNLYKAVAEVLAFVYRLKGKQRTKKAS